MLRSLHASTRHCSVAGNGAPFSRLVENQALAKHRVSDGTWLKGRASSGLAAFTSCRCAKPLQAKCVLPSPPAKRQTFSGLPFFQSAQALFSETLVVRACESMGRAGGSGAAAGIRPSAGNQKPTARAETGTDRVLGCLGGEALYRLWLLFITHKSFAFY